MTFKPDLILDILILFVAMGMAVWSSFRWRDAARERDIARQMAARAETTSEAARRHATAAFLVGSQLLGASDEKAVVESAMQIGCEIYNAIGCSFVPYDEWGRSLPPLSLGHVPQPALNHWNDRLGKAATRQACKVCKTMQANKPHCPLLSGDDESLQVVCVPIQSDGRDIGVINFYFSSGRTPSEADNRFFTEILSIVDRAFEMLRRRDQEVAALRYLQTVQTRNNISVSIKSLLENIQKALDVDVAMLWALEAPDGLNSPLVSESRRDGLPDSVMLGESSFVQGIWQSVSAADGPISLENLASKSPWRTLLAVPLRWGDEKPLGMLLLANRIAHTFNRHQTLLLQTLAGETALLLRNAQLVVQVEYQAVVDERARLAREIHDGMAQTLAFLKIEAQRMQNFAQSGDLTRLTSILDGCYRTLSDAYQDTRVAIDNLRCAPGGDFVGWLKQAAIDFEDDQDIDVDVAQVTSKLELAPHIQAQIMRIVQESFSNVRKHSQAKSVRIVLKEINGEVLLEIIDDGVGFATDDTQPATRHGLRGMRERADLLLADLQVISKPGQGTRVRLQLPQNTKVAS